MGAGGVDFRALGCQLTSTWAQGISGSGRGRSRSYATRSSASTPSPSTTSRHYLSLNTSKQPGLSYLRGPNSGPGDSYVGQAIDALLCLDPLSVHHVKVALYIQIAWHKYPNRLFFRAKFDTFVLQSGDVNLRRVAMDWTHSSLSTFFFFFITLSPRVE